MCALCMARAKYESLSAVGYKVCVEKPLGVIFSDNPEPYLGLVVEEIDPDMNGSKAGLKVGDQLIAVNGESVEGEDFEFVMDFHKISSGTVLWNYNSIEALFDHSIPCWKT